jgi:protein translocase SecG subunit
MKKTCTEKCSTLLHHILFVTHRLNIQHCYFEQYHNQDKRKVWVLKTKKSGNIVVTGFRRCPLQRGPILAILSTVCNTTRRLGIPILHPSVTQCNSINISVDKYISTGILIFKSPHDSIGLMNTVTAFLPYIQLILSILLVAAILLQRSSEGIEGAFGGQQQDFTHFTRRGGEKVLFYSTIVLAVLFAASALIAILG